MGRRSRGSPSGHPRFKLATGTVVGRADVHGLTVALGPLLSDPGL